MLSLEINKLKYCGLQSKPESTTKFMQAVPYIVLLLVIEVGFWKVATVSVLLVPSKSLLSVVVANTGDKVAALALVLESTSIAVLPKDKWNSKNSISRLVFSFYLFASETTVVCLAQRSTSRTE